MLVLSLSTRIHIQKLIAVNRGAGSSQMVVSRLWNQPTGRVRTLDANPNSETTRRLSGANSHRNVEIDAQTFSG